MRNKLSLLFELVNRQNTAFVGTEALDTTEFLNAQQTLVKADKSIISRQMNKRK